LAVCLLPDVSDLDEQTKQAMHYMFTVMDGLTGGSLSRGWREATAAERVAEWDNLAAEQIMMLQQRKGAEWFYEQGAAIEKLRRQLKTT
jgi:hypothetical protein